MQHDQKLSVIIPTKNEERYLPGVLTSLKRQTRQADELIVADAQSTDRTRAIAGEYGCKVVDGGLPGPGRNSGAAVAKGELLFFLDADVVIGDDQFFEKALNEFVERKLDIATADIFLAKGTRLEHFGHHFYNWYVRLWGVKHPHTPGFCILIKKSLFDAIGGFDPTVIFAEDHELGTRASKRGRFGFLDSVRIGLTNRRMKKEGGVRLAIKYIVAELHILFVGPIRHNFFRYEFGYDEE